jgi:hypothetical protein
MFRAMASVDNQGQSTTSMILHQQKHIISSHIHFARIEQEE